jgi:RNA polymerase sigma-70 factor (ECF subfamily)
VNKPSQQLHFILEGCLQKQRGSQKALYDYFYAYSLNICKRYTRSEEDAIEMLQDGYVKVFQHLESFIRPENEDSLYPAFTGWLKKIMIYTSIDHYRSRKKYLPMEDINNHADQPASGNHHPLDHLAYEELMKMIQTLSPGYRAVFSLFVLDGFTHEEIADTLGISVGTSKSNLAKARENLRQKLKRVHEGFIAKYE